MKRIKVRSILSIIIYQKQTVILPEFMEFKIKFGNNLGIENVPLLASRFG